MDATTLVVCGVHVLNDGGEAGRAFEATVRDTFAALWPRACALSAALFGIEIPITGIVADQQSAMFGQGVLERGDVKVTLGTGAFVNLNTGDQIAGSRIEGVRPMIAWRMGSETRYMIETKSGNAALTIEWGKRFGLYTDPRETVALAASVPHTEGVTFAAAFTGLDAPHNDVSARGAIMGMTANTKPAHIVRALLENIAFSVEELVNVLASDFHTHIPIKIDGGVSRNSFIVQLISSLTGSTIDRAENIESTLLGAAYFAGLATKFWHSKEEVAKLRKTDVVIQPKPVDEHTAHSLRRWKETIKRIQKWHFNVADYEDLVDADMTTSQPTSHSASQAASADGLSPLDASNV